MAATHPPREQVIGAFQAQMTASSVNGESHGLRSLGLHVPSASLSQKPYPPCSKSSDHLKPMLIHQMKPQKRHRDRMVIVRVCTPPKTRPYATVAVVEDENGTAVPMSLFNMPTVSTAGGADTILPEGTLCLVKEPFLKRKKKRDTYSIRVDHVTDLVYLSETDSRVPDAWKNPVTPESSGEIRVRGNTHVKEKNWFSALQQYSKAIDVAKTDEEKQLAYINRALVNLRLDRYEAARSDAAHIVDPSVPTAKGLFRLAMAHYGLQDFVKSREVLAQLLAAFPDEPAAKTELARVEARLQEQATGQYSFARMYEHEKTGLGLVDCASFYGPVHEGESPGRGRGLFLTEAVSVGDLILCEKAVVFYRRAPVPAHLRDVIVVKASTPVDPHAKAELSAQVHQKLLHNPEVTRPILDLFSGAVDYERKPADLGAEPVLDSFLINSIIEFNAVSIPAHVLPPSGAASNHTAPSDGVWLRASYLNHACYPNCYRAFIGDMLVVRAAANLAAGTELTVAYSEANAFDSLIKAHGKLERWDFVCTCGLCEARNRIEEHATNEQATIVRQAAETFVDVTLLSRSADRRDMSEMVLRACDAIDAQYPAYAGPGLAPCPEIWTLTFPRQSSLCILGRDTMAMVDGMVASLRGVGFVVAHSRSNFEIQKWGMLLHNLPEALMKLHWSYERLDPRVCPVLRKYARTAFLIMRGEDETFSQYFPSVANV